jgi:hypothetical protein
MRFVDGGLQSHEVILSHVLIKLLERILYGTLSRYEIRAGLFLRRMWTRTKG